VISAGGGGKETIGLDVKNVDYKNKKP